MGFRAIAIDLTGNKDELGNLGGAAFPMPILHAVNIEGIAIFGPEHGKGMPGVQIQIFSALAADKVLMIGAIAAMMIIMGDDFARLKGFHNIIFNACHGGILTAADHRGLHPEGGPPARLFLQFAAAFIVAVAMKEFMLLQLADGPEKAVLRLIGHGVHIIIARLQMGGADFTVLFKYGQHRMGIAIQGYAALLPGGMIFAHHGKAEIPFAAIQLRSVKFIAPGQFPMVALGQKAGFMALDFIFLHFFIPPLVFPVFPCYIRIA